MAGTGRAAECLGGTLRALGEVRAQLAAIAELGDEAEREAMQALVDQVGLLFPALLSATEAEILFCLWAKQYKSAKFPALSLVSSQGQAAHGVLGQRLQA